MSQKPLFKKGFGSDNHSGIHPQILQALYQYNTGHAHAYGLDEVSQLALTEFQRQFGDDIDVHYVFNGTAANVLALGALIKPYESVLCSDQAHLHRDECGAPERYLGCKLIIAGSDKGKITPEMIQPHLCRRGDQHWAQPRVISITQPTEVGTVYSLEEMKALSEFAQQNGLLLHVDGARLANAAVHLQCTFKDLVQGVDALSLGGTKNGLLGVEAVILFGSSRRSDFKFLRKQAMQLPSKMRFLSGQFLTYLQDDLWKSIATQTLKTTQYFHQLIEKIPEIELAYPVQSNALFPILPRHWVKPLKEHSFFYVWDEQKWILRWMISYDTEVSDIHAFMDRINELRLSHPHDEPL